MEGKVNINLGNFFRVIKKEKILICIVTLGIGILGTIFSFLMREEFRAVGKILPEVQSRTGGGLSQFSGLASLAGLDISSLGGGSFDAIRPDLYPDVINSTSFYLKMMEVQIHTKENSSFKFSDFYNKYIEEGEVFEDEQLMKYPVLDSSILVVNKLEDRRLRDLRSRVNASIDRKSGIITISTKMPDPVVAAQTAKFAMDYLMDYIKIYRTEKQKKDVSYLHEQVENARKKYYLTQASKARYSDQFQDMALQSADLERERIDAEYRLTSSFYNELLKKYEEAKYKLHVETPVFKVLEPPVTPVKKAEPRRAIMIAIFTFLGFGVALIMSLFRKKNYLLVFVKDKL